jgi:flagellar FliL protein
MQKSVAFLLSRSLIFLFLTLFLVSTNANAEGKGGDDAYVTLEPFTVNLMGLRQVIQLSVTLKPAKPDMSDKIKAYTPVIRNEIILLLSAKTPEQLQTADGKLKLIVEIRMASNKALGLTMKTGIADVLLESIIIQ